MKTINQLDPKLVEKRSIPSHTDTIYFEELSAVVYIHKERPQPEAKGFSNKRLKHDFYVCFRSLESMEKYIDNWKKSLKNTQVWKQKESEKRKTYKHDFKVGDILNTYWGYDQINVEFYQVTKVISAKSIEICEIASQQCENIEDHVQPCINQFIGKPMKKLVSTYGTVAINSYINASKVKYEHIHCTPWYAGH